MVKINHSDIVSSPSCGRFDWRMMSMDVEEVRVVQNLGNKPLELTVTAEDPWIDAAKRKATSGEEGQR